MKFTPSRNLMGAGVSLFLPQNGFPVRHLYVVSGATFSYLPGFTLPSAIPGRYGKGFRPEVSFLGVGSGHFPPSLSFSCSGLKVSGSADAKNTVAVADLGALASDLNDSAAPFSTIVGDVSSTSPGAIKVIEEFVDFDVVANNDAIGCSDIVSYDPTRSWLDRSDGGVGPVVEGVAVNNVDVGSSIVQCTTQTRSRLVRFGGCVRPISVSPIFVSEVFREADPVASVRPKTSTADAITGAAVISDVAGANVAYFAVPGAFSPDRTENGVQMDSFNSDRFWGLTLRIWVSTAELQLPLGRRGLYGFRNGCIITRRCHGFRTAVAGYSNGRCQMRCRRFFLPKAQIFCRSCLHCDRRSSISGFLPASALREWNRLCSVAVTCFGSYEIRLCSAYEGRLAGIQAWPFQGQIVCFGICCLPIGIGFLPSWLVKFSGLWVSQFLCRRGAGLWVSQFLFSGLWH